LRMCSSHGLGSSIRSMTSAVVAPILVQDQQEPAARFH
jgi:hypothetical protein